MSAWRFAGNRKIERLIICCCCYDGRISHEQLHRSIPWCERKESIESNLRILLGVCSKRTHHTLKLLHVVSQKNELKLADRVHVEYDRTCILAERDLPTSRHILDSKYYMYITRITCTYQ